MQYGLHARSKEMRIKGGDVDLVEVVTLSMLVTPSYVN